MKSLIVFSSVLLLFSCGQKTAEKQQEYPYQPVAFTDVQVADSFWAPRIETNRKVTIPVCFQRCEETGRIANFSRAAGTLDTDFEGIRYNDSDVFKVIEAAAYSLSLHPDPELDAYLDDLIAKIAAAQEEDGYLFTIRTVNRGDDLDGIGPERWTHLTHSHELYNVGHMYEAAAAHYQATGKRSLLDVAIKNADLICQTFGSDRMHDVPGHEEIELGLVKLYRVTGKKEYLEASKFFIDERGHPERRPENHSRMEKPEYAQDQLPVTEQSEIVGHAVRAGYLYAGIADVAALTADQSYLPALDRLWNDVVGRKMYLTGAVGVRGHGEGYSGGYQLPNADAYAETCASIANALWNHRMFLLSGDAKYVDVLERVLYNGFLSGVSLSGDLFFYPNPLAADGKTKFNHGEATRSPWFGTSCCPVNVARVMPSIPGYAYATRDRDVFVNLFIAGEAKVKLGDDTIRLRQETEYPWKEEVRITVDPGSPATFAVNIRIPGWARNEAVPTDLYRFSAPAAPSPTLKVNGEDVPLQTTKGFARIEREWSAGDRIELMLPMPVRRVLANEKVEADRGLVALERGPLVYCVEGIDNGGSVAKLKVPDNDAFSVEYRPDLLGGVTVITAPGFTAIPYYAWSNRGIGDMAVWLPGNAGS